MPSPVQGYPVHQPGSGRLGSRLIKGGPVIITGSVVARIRVRSSASATPIDPRLLRPAARGSKEPVVVPPRSRVVTPPRAVLLAQAVGRVRVWASANAGALTPSMGPLKGRVPNELQRARLLSRVQDVRPTAGFQFGNVVGRVRVRSTATASTFKFAQVVGRVRVRSVTTGGPITSQYLPLEAKAPNQPRSTYRSSRIQKDARPILTGVTVTGQGVGRVRVRAKNAPQDAFIPNTEPFVASAGQVYVAPLGTPAPTSLLSVLDPAFLDLGFISEEGVTLRDIPEVVAKSSWNSLYPKEFKIVGHQVEIGFVLREFNKRAVEFALEGSVVTNAAQWKHDAYNDTSLRKAMVVDAFDGVEKIRIYFPQGVIKADVETTASRHDATNLPVSFGASSTTEDAYTIWRSD